MKRLLVQLSTPEGDPMVGVLIKQGSLGVVDQSDKGQKIDAQEAASEWYERGYEIKVQLENEDGLQEACDRRLMMTAWRVKEAYDHLVDELNAHIIQEAHNDLVLAEELQGPKLWECTVCHSIHQDDHDDDVVCHVCQAERP